MEKNISSSIGTQGYPVWDNERLIAVLSLRKRQLSAAMQNCEKTLQRHHDYSLHLHVCNGFPQYYLYTKGGHRKYIPKTNTRKIKEAAQYDYDRRLLKSACQEYDAINGFLKYLQGGSSESVFKNLDKFRKDLVEPRLPDLSRIISSWTSEEYQALQTFEKKEIYKTEQGVYVRSKSELLIAERLEKNQIPYKYEHPLLLSDGHILYPDFTVLHPRTLKVYYIEHFGMVDDPIYANRMTEKINKYSENNIILGHQLLATFESSQKPLNTSQFDN